MRNGILVGGNWIIDRVKVINKYPAEEALTDIVIEYSSNGGSAYNILKDLRKMGATFPLEAIGLVGDDSLGEHVIKDCMELGINTLHLSKVSGGSTSYTDVMSVQATGKRTFFHHRGTNAQLGEEHFVFDNSRCKIFHLGYVLLLDKLDIIKANGRTGASEVLEEAVNSGLITSVDLVSEDSQRFKLIVPPSLPYIDCLFVNEFEAGKIVGLDLAVNGDIIISKCYEAAQLLLDMGVRRWVILHFPAGAIAVSKQGERLFQPCVNLPSEKIVGAVGAGDAFASGILYGIHENWAMNRSLKLGVCVAASSLMAATCSDGVLCSDECLQLGERYGYRELHNVSV